MSFAKHNSCPLKKEIWPWVLEADQELSKQVDLSVFSPQARKDLCHFLLQRLSFAMTPSVVLELRIARMRNALIGDTPRDRYDFFIQHLFGSSASLAAHLEEYAGLICWKKECVRQWIQTICQFLTHYQEDCHELGIRNKKITKIGLGEGDLHNEGQSVWNIKVDSGEEFFYKPKDLQIVQEFEAMLEELLRFGFPEILSFSPILFCKGRAWAKKIEHKPCTSIQEVKDYFQKSGTYLCLFYLFNGNDQHFENVIACGPHPMFIDLESLMCGEVKLSMQESLERKRSHSVLKTLLLPSFVFSETNPIPTDIGGLTAEFIYGSGGKASKWQFPKTDQMHLRQTLRRFTPYAHRVFFSGKAMAASDFVEDIVEGFSKAHKWFQSHKNRFTQKGGWIDRISQFPSRFIFRSTAIYSKLLSRSLSPEWIRCQNSREESLDGLLLAFNQSNQHLLPLVEEEKKALLRGDIPFFYTLPNQINIYTKEGYVLENCVEQTSEVVRERFEGLCPEDLALQSLLIRNVFKLKESSVHATPKRLRRKVLSNQYTAETIWLEVKRLADLIEKEAIRHSDESLDWLVLEQDLLSNQAFFKPISDSFFDGKCGIALFFASIYALNGEEKYKQTAEKILRGVFHKMDREHLFNYAKGQVLGQVGGICYCLLQIGSLIKEKEPIQRAFDLARIVEEKDIEGDRSLDVLLGTAGLLISLLTLIRHTPDPLLLEKAKFCGLHLCKQGVERGEETFWQGALAHPVLGISHGASGIAYALYQLFKETQDLAYLESAQKGWNYESRHFCSERKGWPDLRSKKGGLKYLTNWCNGSAGAVLARLEPAIDLGLPNLSSEVRIALEGIAQNGSTVFFLCCGAAGEYEALREAARLLKEPHLEERCRLYGSQIFTEAKQRGGFEKTLPFFRPGFMQGISGFGFMLLKQLDHEDKLPLALLLR